MQKYNFLVKSVMIYLVLLNILCATIFIIWGNNCRIAYNLIADKAPLIHVIPVYKKNILFAVPTIVGETESKEDVSILLPNKASSPQLGLSIQVAFSKATSQAALPNLKTQYAKKKIVLFILACGFMLIAIVIPFAVNFIYKLLQKQFN